MMIEFTFEGFPKIPRLRRTCTITEKIDGTNAQIIVEEDESGMRFVHAASRNRLITPDDDNFGFARWVADHSDELKNLGPGRHFGEWWGQGIQRRYDLMEKRFSLFNVNRWGPNSNQSPPDCCHVVPTLFEGEFSTYQVDRVLEDLIKNGSKAAPEFMNPEGIIIFHHALRGYFKQTLGGDGNKGAQ